MPKRLLALSLLLAAVIPAGARASALPGCTDADAGSTHAISDEAFGTGKMALPAAEPAALAVFAHGYSHKSDSWVQHMLRTAEAGAIAVTVDYRGTYVDGQGNVRGWFVQEGADDLVAVTTAILAACPSIERVILYGVSMGANASGLALTRGAEKPDGSLTPLFDYWVAAEPAANVIETYAGATAIAPVNAFAALAKADIEQAFGGTIAQQPAAYVNASVVARIRDIAATGLRGAWVLHGLDDGLVPYNQGRELTAALRAHNISTEFYNAVRRNPAGNPDHEGGTTISENVGDPVFGAAGLGAYPEPLTGHGSESSQTHIVIQTGLQIVFDLISGAREDATNGEYILDGEAGTVRVL